MTVEHIDLRTRSSRLGDVISDAVRGFEVVGKRDCYCPSVEEVGGVQEQEFKFALLPLLLRLLPDVVDSKSTMNCCR